MTDSNFIYKPRTGGEMKYSLPPDSEIYLYTDLCKIPQPAYKVILSLAPNAIVLLQNPQKLNSGHWIALARHPETKEIYHFNSYGGMPDREKLKWIPPYQLIYSGQNRNIINDGLKELAYMGWTIHYNDYPFQVEGDKTATCGIWASAFLNSGQNPDEFAENHGNVGYYFRKYFQ